MKTNISHPDIPVSTDNHLYFVDEWLVKFAQIYMDTPRKLIEQGQINEKSVTERITEYTQKELFKV